MQFFHCFKGWLAENWLLLNTLASSTLRFSPSRAATLNPSLPPSDIRPAQAIPPGIPLFQVQVRFRFRLRLQLQLFFTCLLSRDLMKFRAKGGRRIRWIHMRVYTKYSTDFGSCQLAVGHCFCSRAPSWWAYYMKIFV